MSVVVVTDSKSTVIRDRFVRPRLVNSLVDLNNVWSITEEAFDPILITATEEPAEPQLTVTITALPTANDFVQDWAAIFQTGLSSIDSEFSPTLHFVLTKNGADLPNTVGQVFLDNPPGQPYDFLAGLFASSPIIIGDVLGIKLWIDASEEAAYLNSSLYIVPRMLGPIAGKQTQSFSRRVSSQPPYGGNGPTGVLVGVAYQNVPVFLTTEPVMMDPLAGFIDSGEAATTSFGPLNPFVNIQNGPFDNFSTANTQSATPILAALNSDAGWLSQYQILS